jgi:hypothetical protein
LLDGTVDARNDWHTVLVDGEMCIGVRLAPGHIPAPMAPTDRHNTLLLLGLGLDRLPGISATWPWAPAGQVGLDEVPATTLGIVGHV